MKRLNLFICAAAALLFAANHSFAGTMTPAASPSPQPSFSPAAVVTNNTIGVQQATPSVLKIFGSATITPGAGASSVFLTLTGTFTANPTDLASYAYNFNINLQSATPATFTLSLSAGGFSTSTTPQTIPANSNQAYTGRGQTAATPIGASGNFTGQLRIDFAAGTTASDKLTLTIPQNSIDFAVQPTAIPEPSTYALLALGLGGVALHARRKRAVA